jgi:probable F420-dependent oxidoreductase
MRRWGFRAAYRTVEDMFSAQNLDAVFVLTPRSEHAHAVEACLRRDVDVFCEKPLAPSADEAERLADLADQQGRLLMVDFNRRYAPAAAVRAVTTKINKEATCRQRETRRSRVLTIPRPAFRNGDYDKVAMRMNWSERLGIAGVWRGVNDIDRQLAETIEDLGYGAIWLGGSPGSDLREAEQLLDVTELVHVATGVVNIWKSDAAQLAGSYFRIEAKHPGRLLLGIGSGHREATPERVRPIEAMARYLDILDDRGVPVEARVLSALGPRMLAVAAARSAGTHPYLTVPSLTREARSTLGADALVAPEQTVVFDADPDSARSTARAFLRSYLSLSNYTTTLRRGGFRTADLAGEGSDFLVDRVVAHGDAPSLAVAVRAHLDAGADHVCVQVQPVRSDIVPALRAIAAEIGLRSNWR